MSFFDWILAKSRFTGSNLNFFRNFSKRINLNKLASFFLLVRDHWFKGFIKFLSVPTEEANLCF